MRCACDCVQVDMYKAHLAVLSRPASKAAARGGLKDATNVQRGTSREERAASKAQQDAVKELEELAAMRRRLKEHAALEQELTEAREALKSAKLTNRSNAAQAGIQRKAAESARTRASIAEGAAENAAALRAELKEARKELAECKSDLEFIRRYPHVVRAGGQPTMVVPQRDQPKPNTAALRWTSPRRSQDDGRIVGGVQYHWALHILACELKAEAGVADAKVPQVVNLVLLRALNVYLDPCAAPLSLPRTHFHAWCLMESAA